MKSNDDKEQKRWPYDGRINVAFYFNHQPQYAIDVIDANNFISYCKLLNRQTHAHSHTHTLTLTLTFTFIFTFPITFTFSM